eukprot:6428629-Prorocentrum_lima.AAC.1
MPSEVPVMLQLKLLKRGLVLTSKPNVIFYKLTVQLKMKTQNTYWPVNICRFRWNRTIHNT